MGTIATSVSILFVLIFLGYYIGKRKIVRQDAAPDLSALVLQITMPVTVFLALVTQDAQTVISNLWIMVAVAAFHIVACIFGVISAHIRGVPKQERGIWIYNTMLSNNGFMGLPLAQAVYGSQGLILMALGNVITNLLIFSVGIKLVQDSSDESGECVKLKMRQVVWNNINIAVVLGFIVCLLSIPIPDGAYQLLGYIGNITSGLSMLVVGLSLSRHSIFHVFSGRRVYELTFVRLVLVPIITIVVLKWLPLQMNEVFVSVIILTAALPASAAQSMLAEQYGGDTEITGKVVFMTTLLSVITVPAVMMMI